MPPTCKSDILGRCRKQLTVTRVQIEGRIQGIMSLFCKQCNSRRLPRWIKEDNVTLWLCETCGNFIDSQDNIVRKL
ncbi:MAG: hypothetical protein COW27_05600 [Nitrosopumilales archaeon CG15_BIG_FIL_POST_REV_8_21_14_020_37_12]|nr:MAG: hypothetical protein COW27_05600 [Nitrosopumilales archaeon CG15_BIG_FIL_POST_REV_8_21_14_020_37_12]